MSILKIIFQLVSVLLFLGINNSNNIDISSRNNKKLAKSKKLGFIKVIYGAKKPCFPTSNVKQIFIKLR